MFSFQCMSRERTVRGIFSDDGKTVVYPTEQKLEIRPLTEEEIEENRDYSIIRIESDEEYSLDAYLTRQLHEHVYRVYPITGEKVELFTAWEDRGNQPGSIIFLDNDMAIYVDEGADRGQTIYYTDLEGKNRRLWTEEPIGGVSYSMSLSPDRTKVAFHNTGGSEAFCPRGAHYAINIVNADGSGHKMLYALPGHLMFGPVWTPDSKYVVFQDCYADKDPGHYFSDIVIANVETGEVRYLTEGQASYFGTSYGRPDRIPRGGGSNRPYVLDDGRIIFTRRSPNAHPDCRYDAAQGNHREDVYAPENARGGANLVIYDPKSGESRDITQLEEGKWDFRATKTGDPEVIAYVTARCGDVPEIHLIRLDGTEDRMITRGFEDEGADYPSYSNVSEAVFLALSANGK